MIESREKFAEVYHREASRWASVIYQIEDTILLKSIEVNTVFEDIYAKTSLE